MKNSIVIKFIAVLVCTAALLGIGCSGLGLLALGSVGMLGTTTAEEVRQDHSSSQRYFTAEQAAVSWASNTLGGVPKGATDAMLDDMISNFFNPEHVYYSVYDADGNQVYSNYNGSWDAIGYSFTFPTLTYEAVWDQETEESAPAEADEAAPDADADSTAETEVTYGRGSLPEEGPADVYTREVYSRKLQHYYLYNAVTQEVSGLSVRLYLGKGAELADPAMEMLETLWLSRRTLIGVLIAGALVFAISAVYLCCCAGRTKGTDTVKAGGLNAMPLDLYAGILLLYIFFALLSADELGWMVLQQSPKAAFYCIAGLGFFACLIFVGFCFAFVAQIKTGDYFWWRNSLCGRCIRLGHKLLRSCFRFLIQKFFPWMWRTGKALTLGCMTIAGWFCALAGRFLKRICSAVRSAFLWLCQRLEHFFARLPLTWQWIILGIAMILILAVSFTGSFTSAVLGCCICLILVLFGANSFGTLLEATREMRRGNLEKKIDDRFLLGSFRDFSEELNGLADVAVVAAEKQLKSDRMKTELITNVSHDIKTPLTSIINYVDLLAKPHTPEEEKNYLDVLKRQSARMKKLIEDLIEMSKATTGNIPVEIGQVDAVEAVNQAIGEFSDKLTAAGLTPVFRQPKEAMIILADGRLVWRAMSNLLSNAVKYALPGTRLYIDVSSAGETVLISMKNISRAELNVSADELLERFVRGDTSRNTEGSGLGLNIAQSLMELQKGQLQLLVDGDLFKVTMIFPKG